MDLSAFLARLDGVEETPDGWLAICPAHSDSDPSLRVAVGKDGDRVLVRCRTGCETKDVLGKMGLSIRDLASMTIDGKVPTSRRATTTDAPPEAAVIAGLVADLDRWADALAEEDASYSTVLDYAERRFGISAEEAMRLRLGLSETDTPRLVVPFYDVEGLPRGYQARAIDPAVDLRWKGPKRPEGGGSWLKYGTLHGSSGWGEVLVTEGPGDGLTGVALGYDVFFIAGSGNASNPGILDALATYAAGRKVIACGDGDRAGQQFSTAIAQGMTERGVTVAKLAVPDDSDLSKWRESDKTGRSIVRAIMEAPEESSYSAALSGRDQSLYPLTDLGNARFLRDYARSQGSDLRFAPESGFFVLDGGVWRPDDLDASRAYAQEAAEMVARIARTMAAEAVTKEQEAAAKAWRAWANYSQSSRGIDAAIREVKALRDVATPLDKFDQRHDLLAAANGVIDLRTGDLLPHDPAYLLTRRIDLPYRKDAKAPRWEKFLGEVFAAYPALPAYMRRLVGYGITGRTDEQCFVVHVGKGANGKSVLTDTLTEVFREATVTTPFSTFEAKPSGGIPNDIAALKGARLVMASEGEANKPMAEAMLKRVTGRDLIAARFMRKEFFEFRPTFLIMLASNYKPQFRGQDEGLWRRVKLIPWERYFAPHERDPRLGTALLAEAEGILAWAVRGAVEWYEGGLRDPEVVKNAVGAYRETSDALYGFLPGEWLHDEEARAVPATDLYLSYREWCQHEGIRDADAWTKRTFNAALEERGLTKRRAASGMVFDGVRRATAKDAAEQADAEPGAERAEAAPLAHSSSATSSISGASLDAIL
jgi:putative DNA primase/helicase